MSDQPPADNVRALRAAATVKKPPNDPPKGPPPDQGPPHEDDGREPGGFLPEGCPVQPLGVAGSTCYYLDQLGQFREVAAKDHSRLNIVSLFGRLPMLLEDYWPRRTQDKRTQEWIVTGWKPEEGALALMSAAAAKGVWSPMERLRGRGAWRGDDGELVLHLGDRLLIVPADGARPRYKPPGLVDGYVYPTAPAGLTPHGEKQPAGEAGPAYELLQVLRTWNFEGGHTDAYLMLGVTVAQMLGGALQWRPVHWLSGGKATGKSTLQELRKHLQGSAGLLNTPDGTAAGIRQTLGYASLPVDIDEAEAEEDPRALNQLIRFARNAATGAVATRGGSDHKAAAFTIRTCLGFASILRPSMTPQDKSRIAVFNLRALDPRARRPDTSPARAGALGSRLLRRVVDQWPRFAQTLELYRDALADGGHAARGQDVYGTLLACADLVLYDQMPDIQSLKAWAVKLSADVLADNQGDGDDVTCLIHLLGQPMADPHSRIVRTIGEWVQIAAGKTAASTDTADEANRMLMACGVKIVWENLVPWVAVANTVPGLAKIFAGTQWQKRSGGDGVWIQSLRRLDGARIPRDGAGKQKSTWFGVPDKATYIPLHHCLPQGDSPATATAPADGAPPGTPPPMARPAPSDASASPLPPHGPDPDPPWDGCSDQDQYMPDPDAPPPLDD